MNDVTFINGISENYSLDTMFYVEVEEQNTIEIDNYMNTNELGTINWEQQERNVYPFISTFTNIFILLFVLIMLIVTLLIRILDVSKKS